MLDLSFPPYASLATLLADKPSGDIEKKGRIASIQFGSEIFYLKDDGISWQFYHELKFASLSDMLAFPTLNSSAMKKGLKCVCLESYFGEQGATFSWSVSKNRWIPVNVVIYGSGIESSFTASAGDISTDVKMGEINIPDSIIPENATVELHCIGKRPATGGINGTTVGKIKNNAFVQMLSLISLSLSTTAYMYAVMIKPLGFPTTLERASSGSVSPFASTNNYAFLPIGGLHNFQFYFNANTVDTVQTLKSFYAVIKAGSY